MIKNHKLCSVSSCRQEAKVKGFCGRHYQKWYRCGDPLAGRNQRQQGTGSITNQGYIDRTVNGERRLEHIRVAERVLGRPLPGDAVVHHHNENRQDNRPKNLVICPNGNYHKLLHRRMRALAACGYAHWRKYWICKCYDDPDRLVIRRRGNKDDVTHRQCM